MDITWGEVKAAATAASLSDDAPVFDNDGNPAMGVSVSAEGGEPGLELDFGESLS